jgi:hypothetical protein
MDIIGIAGEKIDMEAKQKLVFMLKMPENLSKAELAELENLSKEKISEMSESHKRKNFANYMLYISRDASEWAPVSDIKAIQERRDRNSGDSPRPGSPRWTRFPSIRWAAQTATTWKGVPCLPLWKGASTVWQAIPCRWSYRARWILLRDRCRGMGGVTCGVVHPGGVEILARSTADGSTDRAFKHSAVIGRG